MEGNTDKYQLDQLKKEFDEFTYIVSHDLKAPLRAIDNITEWIEDDFGEDVDPDIIANFKLLKNRVLRMDKMIAALTKYSRVNRRELELVETNVNEVLLEIKEDIEDRYDNVSLNIDVQFPIITTYKNKLYKVLQEIILNAAVHNQVFHLLH